MIYQNYPHLAIILFSIVYKADSVDYNECSCLKNRQIDNCPTSHFKRIPNSHFILPTDGSKKSWSQAKASCESFGAELAQSSNYAENKAIQTAIVGDGNSGQYWVGVVQKSTGKIVYADGITPISFSPRISSSRNGECVFAKKNRDSPYSIVYGMEECSQQKDYICQFKKGSLCHVTSGLPGLRDTLLPDSGLYISLVQKPWADAEFDCKQHNMLLLTGVQKVKINLPELLGLVKSKYHWDEVWTSGKFASPQYGNLMWSTNGEAVSNYKSSSWNPLSSVWEPKEPYDKSGTGTELCLLMNIKENSKITWSAENCLVPKYYICMQGLRSATPRANEGMKGRSFTRNGDKEESSDDSYMEFCDGSTKVRMTSTTCSRNVMLCSQKPDCICYNGVHGVTDHDTCTASLYTGKSCVRFSTTEDVHWKILKNIPAEPFVYLQTRNPKSGNYIQWSKMMKESTRQLLGPTTIFYSGVQIFKLSRTTYCFQENDGDSAADLSQISQVSTGDSISRIYFTHLCVGADLTEYTGDDIQTTATPITSQCSLSCSSSGNIAGRSFSRDSDGNDPTDVPTKEHPEKPNVASERERQKALNTLLVQDAIDSAFPDYQNKLGNSKFKPERSFKLLEKLFEIAKHVCADIVAPQFFNKGLELFKVLHYGKMYEYNEYFTQRESNKIDELLDKCMAQQEVAQVRLDNCTGQVTHTENVYPNGTLDVRPVDITGYAALPQHHIPELTWNVIDIMNVVCLRSFRSSYLLYHTLEQGMENLYTNEIRRLWHHPLANEDVYKQILGAGELTNMINLRSCADSVYQRYNLVSRLERPREVVYREFKGSSSLNSTSGIDENTGAKCSPKAQCKI